MLFSSNLTSRHYCNVIVLFKITDRPDSRSTDEEIIQSPPLRERSLSKNNNNGRIPKDYANGHQPQNRSVSCERPQENRQRVTKSNGNSESGHFSRPNISTSNARLNQTRLSQGNKPVKSSTTPSHILKTLPPTRSLSASGTTDFFKNYSRPTRLQKSPTSVSCNRNGQNSLNRTCPPQNNTTPTPSGKNTWNGNSRSSSRARPNLFHANYFNNSRSNSRTDLEHQNADDETSAHSLNLAEWIKKALELDSDAAKISHIEQAIKQFEQQGPNNNYNNSSMMPDFEVGSMSLPYSTNYDSLSPSSSELPSISSTISSFSIGGIKKRKDNGLTRIPKPNFF